MEALEYGDWAAQSSETVLKAAGSSGLVLHCYHQTWGLHSVQGDRRAWRVRCRTVKTHTDWTHTQTNDGISEG